MSEFIWTEDMAIEYSHYYHDAFQDMVRNMGKDILKEFKASKQPKKDWEIVFSFDLDGNCGTHPFIPKDEPCGCEEEGCKIHSVRRLSDGCVFTVGDLIGWGVPSGYQTIIVSFSIADSRLKIDYQPEGLNLLSVDFEKAVRLHKKVKQPLFTTEDGVEIYEGDKTFWVVNAAESDWQVKNFIATHDCIGENWYCFSTEAAAKEYVKMSKPNLSVRDVLQTLKSIFEKTGEYHPSHGTISLELQAVSKSKI